MKKDERLLKLTELLKQHNALPIPDLEKDLGVSHMTVRRDLRILEAQGIVRLIHGGAVLIPDTQEQYQLPRAAGEKAEEKDRIARKAVSLIERGRSIILDTGSTTEYIARFIPEGQELCVLCFSLNSILPLSKKEGVKIILPGGYFHENTLMFESPEGTALIKRTRAEIAFISASGIDPDLGVTCATLYETETKQAALASARKKVLVADSSKFGRVSATWFADLSACDILITDTGLSAAFRQKIKKSGVRLITV